MKLLLDQNLSPGLIARLTDLFPGSVHVRDVGLQTSDDDSVWKFAIEHGLCIVSKGADFHQLSCLRGIPPKVIWIQRGNCSTLAIEQLLRTQTAAIIDFGADTEAGFLALK